MAKISAFNNFRFDFRNPDSMNVGDWIGQPIVSSTKVSVPTNAGVFDLYGSNFSFNFQTGAVSGLVTEVTFSQNGQLTASISDLNLSAAEVLSYAQLNNGAYLLVDRLLSGDDSMKLSGGNDVVAGLGGSDTIDAGEGFDIVQFAQNASSYTIGRVGDAIVVRDAGGDTDTLINVERVQFAGETLALDTDGIAGAAYRLYQAAFDRAPDQQGLGYWIDELDAGKGDLAWMANNFIISEEFKDTYGTPSSVSNEAFLELIYNNVLDRAPDGEGYQYWMAELNRGFERERVLASFSESDENRANVADAIADGIWYF
ncbi:DUF4214 domain-containing protein [Devosia submarina]|uniref:DUF4214 domain-containing protein n=1 Tax=Devosia submarina TaxID=1173082 RepID=UPI000D36B66E|nr:DUF4214 domain-containing protein [Devosia submarina]